MHHTDELELRRADEVLDLGAAIDDLDYPDLVLLATWIILLPRGQAIPGRRQRALDRILKRQLELRPEVTRDRQLKARRRELVTFTSGKAPNRAARRREARALRLLYKRLRRQTALDPHIAMSATLKEARHG